VIEMAVVLIGIAALIVGAPIVAALVVAVASRREDAHWTLDQPARTPLEAGARRILAFNVDSIEWPRSKAQVQAEAEMRSYWIQRLEPASAADPWGQTDARKAS
jgi:hypothetical protein